MYVSQGTSDAITRVDFVKAKSKLDREMSYLLVLIWIAPREKTGIHILRIYIT